MTTPGSEESVRALGDALIAAGQNERPRSDARARTLAALGIGAAAAAATTTATAATAAAAATGNTALATGAKALTGSLAVKLGIAAIAATAAMGGGWLVAHHARVPAETHVEAPPASAAAVSATSAAPSVAIVIAPSAEPLTSAAPSASAVPSVTKVVSSSSASLAAELASLGAARRALAAHDYAGCLAMLDRHQHDYPRGSFSDEVTVMRIEAMLGRGDRAGARALADRFLATHASSPYAARVHSLLRE